MQWQPLVVLLSSLCTEMFPCLRLFRCVVLSFVSEVPTAKRLFSMFELFLFIALLFLSLIPVSARPSLFVCAASNSSFPYFLPMRRYIYLEACITFKALYILD